MPFGQEMPNAHPKIILVEDDSSMREAMERLLGAAGFACDAYASAEALLAEISSEGVACVVSDLKLPAMSGLDLLDELKSREWTPTPHSHYGPRRAGTARGSEKARGGRVPRQAVPGDRAARRDQEGHHSREGDERISNFVSRQLTARN